MGQYAPDASQRRTRRACHRAVPRPSGGEPSKVLENSASAGFLLSGALWRSERHGIGVDLRIHEAAVLLMSRTRGCAWPHRGQDIQRSSLNLALQTFIGCCLPHCRSK